MMTESGEPTEEMTNKSLIDLFREFMQSKGAVNAFIATLLNQHNVISGFGPLEHEESIDQNDEASLSEA